MSWLQQFLHRQNKKKFGYSIIGKKDLSECEHASYMLNLNNIFDNHIDIYDSDKLTGHELVTRVGIWVTVGLKLGCDLGFEFEFELVFGHKCA